MYPQNVWWLVYTGPSDDLVGVVGPYDSKTYKPDFFDPKEIENLQMRRLKNQTPLTDQTLTTRESWQDPNSEDAIIVENLQTSSCDPERCDPDAATLLNSKKRPV